MIPSKRLGIVGSLMILLRKDGTVDTIKGKGGRFYAAFV